MIVSLFCVHKTHIQDRAPSLEINLSLGFISYLASGLLYLFLLAIYFVGSQLGRISKPFVLLLCATLIWSGLLTLSQIGASIAFEMVTIAELMRYFTWFYILHSAAGYHLEGNSKFHLSNPLTPRSVCSIIFVVALVSLASNDFWAALFEFESPIALQIGWMLLFLHPRFVTGRAGCQKYTGNGPGNDCAVMYQRGGDIRLRLFRFFKRGAGAIHRLRILERPRDRQYPGRCRRWCWPRCATRTWPRSCIFRESLYSIRPRCWAREFTWL